ncbi:MAG: bile acid:sodium symporter [Deinococcus sp.]|uniref:bile acid:sodium symporter family protein n=1 Tax=Deinococcus sp. TaxID=47478 RepID=UPI0026DC1DB3|nr:bile acid:sodium symporter [Deinococcus sp.]MDO4246406.1 bile acid:sodium symporter [Deinococcus sp.]
MPVFVFSTMFNVGLTQKLADILDIFKEWPFVLRMLLANFVLAPLAMFLMLKLAPFSGPLETGLLIYSLTAGAPFLIRLTQLSDHDVSLGASLMMLLVAATALTLPLSMGLLMPEVQIDGGLIAKELASQLLLPVAFGMLAANFLPAVAKTVQPWIAKIGNYTLYIVIFATIAGYLPRIGGILGEGAFLVGILFLVISFGLGYLLGGKNGRDDLQDVGALATAQRGTAAAMIIATQNFADTPEVMIIITLISMLGIVGLMAAAKKLSKDEGTAPADG